MRARFLALMALALAGAGRSEWRWQLPAGREPPPVPVANPMSDAKVTLGRRLFYDADLSIDGTMACATCHEQKHAFADGNRTHPGVHGDAGRRNVPGLANVAWRRTLTWADPTMRTLEAQAAMPIAGEHPVEMGMKGAEQELTRRLGRDGCYRQMFASAFPETGDAITMARVRAALAAFQRTLLSGDSPYDRWRQGKEALPAAAIRGQAVFRANCTACHAGPDLTDDAFHRVDRQPVTPDDRGSAEVTGRASDEGRFRTPSLRNVAVTAPYFHDGASPKLADAILRHRDMTLAPEAVTELTAFLDTLTDRAFMTDPRFAYPDEACGRKL
jgi:cytochrome c peroxidase